MPYDSTPAIAAENVSKRYYLRRGPSRQLKATLLSMPARLLGRGTQQAFWALQDISFTLQRGECLGLAGPNGSGKSTLLGIISGISLPTTGSVTTHGRVSPLLELGSGFHPQISGRENALLNAVLLGLSLNEAREILPKIIEFSELGDFIDQPMRTYSSGMYVRLGFAVLVYTRPKILAVDEVLGVGDAEFQKKCFSHMQKLRSDGVTIVIASHDLVTLTKYTDRVMLLEHGKNVMEGNPAEVTHAYLTSVFGPDAAEVNTG